MSDSHISSQHLIEANQKTEERNYWMEKLAGYPGKASFPFDRAKKSEDHRPIRSIPFQLDTALYERLVQVSNNSDLRLGIILTTGVMALLAKYAGTDDVTIGIPIYRQEEEKDFINTLLPLRAAVTPEMSFKDLLIAVSRDSADACDNANYPMETLLYNLDYDYIPSEDFPLLDVIVLLDSIQEKKYIDHFHVNTVFTFSRTDTGLQGILEYNSAHFEESTVQSVTSHFATLLKQGLQQIDAPLSQLHILLPGEKELILTQFNDTTLSYPRNESLDALFQQQVKAAPQTIATVYHDDDTNRHQQLTYHELNLQAARLANRLIEMGVQPGHNVALMVERSVQMIVGILGILKAGAAYVPVNPEYPFQRIRVILDDSNAKVLLTQPPYSQNLNVPGILVLDLHDSATYPTGDTPPPEEATADSIAYILYTSGSSGAPKGVLIRHRHVANLVYGLEERIYRHYAKPLNVALVAPFVFDASVQQIFASLLLGHTLYIVPENTRVDGERLLAFYRDNPIHVTDGTPAHLQLMVNSKSAQPLDISLKHLIIGGEELPLPVTRDFLALFRNPPTITNIYGPAECCVDCVSFDVTQEAIRQYHKIPIGTPMANRRIYILDTHKQLQPVGVPGELCIGGEGVGLGYLNRDSLTGEKFIPNPFEPGQQMYCSGDLARWLPDGNIQFMGRIDHQVKIRGLRIELGEIENQAMNHPHVKEAVVNAITTDDGDTYLCAYVTTTTNLDMGILRDHLALILPEYMIPSFFVPMESFPLTPNGKIDRQALPLPQFKQEGEIVPPNTDIEKKLVDIWSDVLRLDRTDIGIDNPFFEMGGHSLKATLLIAKIHGAFNVKIPMADIFGNSTIRQLARFIEQSNHAISHTPEPLEQLEDRPHYQLSSVQRRLFMLQQMEPQSIVYNIFDVFQFPGLPEPSILEKIFHQLILRHESLRTSFHIPQIEPVAVVHKEVSFDIRYFQCNEPDQVHQVVREFTQPFDLSAAPLMRAGVVTVREQDKLLLLDMHHIISDGVSRDILIDDFMAALAGEELPPLAIQYKEFAQWQNQLLENRESAMTQQEEFWLSQFSQPAPRLNLPIDFSRPPIQDYSGAFIEDRLSPKRAEALAAMAQQEDVTMFMLTIAIFYVLLSKVCSQEDIVIGSPVSGRSHPSVEKVVGPFVNTIPLRYTLSPQTCFTAFLQQLKKYTLDAFENQDYPFEHLVQQLVKERDTSRNQLFDVAFSFDGSNQDKTTLTKAQTDSSYQYQAPVSRFDFILFVLQKDDHIELAMEYATALFKEETVRYLLKQYDYIAGQVLENKDIALKDIAITHDLQVGSRNLLKEESGGFEF